MSVVIAAATGLTENVCTAVLTGNGIVLKLWTPNIFVKASNQASVD